MQKDKKISHTYIRDGVYYYERRVPVDLLSQYKKAKVVFSLKTKRHGKAQQASNLVTAHLDEYWFRLRCDTWKKACKPYLGHVLRGYSEESSDEGSSELTIFHAAEMYIKLKGNDRPATFKSAAYRAAQYFDDSVGQKTIEQINRSDAVKFRNGLIERGLAGSSVARVFGTVRSILTTVYSETGIDSANPLRDLFIDTNRGATKRLALPTKDVIYLQQKCMESADELRWLLALVSDSGVRLAEAVGLLVSDVNLHHEIPHICITPHLHRRLKTRESERIIPLVGMSRLACERLLGDEGNSKFVFPRYNQQPTSNANSASASLNKWMKLNGFERYSVHSLRHSFRDRLRNVECPVDIANQLGGWANSGIGSQYGTGYPLNVLHSWMVRAVQSTSPVSG